MSEQVDQQGAEPQVVPEDPEYQLEEHILFKHKQQAKTHLFKTLIQQNLTQFSLIMDGTNFAFTKLNLKNKGLQQISEIISSYPHLRNIDFGFNQVQDVGYLQKLKYLTELNLENNQIMDIKFLQSSDNFPYLKKLNLQGNKIVSLTSINLKNLTHLNLNNNKILSLDQFEGHPKLQVLEMRKNKLKNLKGLTNLLSLKELYIAENLLTSFDGFNNVPKLVKIHARKNKIESLAEFPQVNSLKYLNLRENLIKSLNDLSGIPNSVQILNLLACPLSEQLGDNTKKEVWMRYRNFQRINKSEVGGQQKQQYDKEYKDRLAEQQRERLQKQAAQRQARQAAEREAAQKQS